MNKSFYQRDNCRLCGKSNLESVLPLVPTALCDAYVPAQRVNEAQEVFPLELFLCRDCGYAHLPYVVDPKIIYLDYIYVSTSSLGLSEHFCNYAEEVVREIKPRQDSLVIDIGSNDGTLLRFFKNRGLRVLGIEPASEIAKAATESGIETMPVFFTAEVADRINKDYGVAAIITINNLFANLDDLEGVTEGIRKLLATDSIFIIESSYLGDMVQNMVFDFIYHEHLSYFSIKPLVTFLRRFKMELIDIKHIATKGGSLRYYFQAEGGPRSISPAVEEMMAQEDKLGLDRIDTFKEFSDKIEDRKSRLIAYLSDLKAKGKTIVGYGGSATSTTLIYRFGLGKIMDYIVDDNPAKQNTFSPGYHIPVFPSKVLYEQKPDYVLILAWRYAAAIIKKHRAFLKQGGHFILPLPEVQII